MTDLHDAAPEPETGGELFLDFANTVELTAGQPTELLPSGAALRAWLDERALVGTGIDADDVETRLPAFRELRQVIRDIVERVSSGRRPTAGQVRAMNRVMREGIHYHELRTGADGISFAVGQVGDELDQARSAIAGSLAHYLADHPIDRLRVCANGGCRWVFVDRSPAGRRRWCDMRTCGNRAKVARHRARARASVRRQGS